MLRYKHFHIQELMQSILDKTVIMLQFKGLERCYMENIFQGQTKLTWSEICK